MSVDLTRKQHFVDRHEILEKIALLMRNLTGIKDSGEFLVRFDGGLVVDDKSWGAWNWPQGVGLYGIHRYWRQTKDPAALEIVNNWFEGHFAAGLPLKNINTMAPLLTLAFLYEDTGDERYLPYMKTWAEWAMRDLPRTRERGMQHDTFGADNRNQLWDDTLMMTVLALAKIGVLLGRGDYIEEAKYQFLIHVKYLVDRETGLWYHGWTFEGNHNFARALWARGNCWITVAIPEIIDILELPEGDFFRAFLVETLARQIEALVQFQDGSGLWHTLLDDPSSYLEASATAGFAYGILKAVHERYVSPSYEEAGVRAVRGVLGEISATGALQKVSVGTAVGNTKDFYKTIAVTEMPYGQSLAVLCLTEYLVNYI